MKTLDDLLQESAAHHRHLCPRQVLGIRIGLFAGEVLGLELPQSDKRLLTIVETDGCAADGIAVATNCCVGHRTLRVQDYGKVAATCVDTLTGQAVRIAPRAQVRQRARAFAPQARNKWEAQLLGYQLMPAEELLSVQVVQLNTSIEQIVGRAGNQVTCDICGEEIMNEREVLRNEMVLCASCAGESYYSIVAEFAPMPIWVAVRVGVA